MPFNNQCSAIQKTSTNLGFLGLSLEVPSLPTQHVKATLPPTIYFPGEAEIRYYIKTTVNRPGILRENPREFANLNFVPIEPPRPVADGEAYARRQHQFITDQYIPPPWERKPSNSFRGLFRRDSSTPTSPLPPPSPSAPSAPARFSVDARLPNPAILTCGEDIPLRIIFKQLGERNEPLYLQTLQVELIGYTKVRAEDAVRTETHSWVITSLSNLAYPIGSPADLEDTETDLTKEFWDGKPLPNTVAPSFVTCNIQRWYELAVSVGLSYGNNKQRVCFPFQKPQVPCLPFLQDQFVVLPLRSKVEVYSGIRPPAALLKRMALAPGRPGAVQKPTQPQPRPSQPRPPRPVSASPSSVESAQQDELPPMYDEAPPSYEDAIASDLPPIDGPRPDYAPPALPQGESTLRPEKR